MENFTIVDSALFDEDTEETVPIAGIPEYHKKTFGNYKGSAPSMAASKALSSIYKHMAKYPDWFPTYDSEDPPKVIMVIKKLSNQKLYAYLGEVIFKSDPVELESKSVSKPRIHRKTNKIQSIALADVGW